MEDKDDDGQAKIQLKESPLMYTQKKFMRTTKFMILENVRLLINMKAISGILYVKSLIKRAELAKFLFTRDIEYGQQVYIPHELN